MTGCSAFRTLTIFTCCVLWCWYYCYSAPQSGAVLIEMIRLISTSLPAARDMIYTRSLGPRMAEVSRPRILGPGAPVMWRLGAKLPVWCLSWPSPEFTEAVIVDIYCAGTNTFRKIPRKIPNIILIHVTPQPREDRDLVQLLKINIYLLIFTWSLGTKQ